MTVTHRLGSDEVEARRHTGTNESAEALAAWIRSHSTRVDVLHVGEYEYDKEFAFLRLIDRFDSLVRPGFWIVKTEDHHFYNVYPDVFTHMYVSVGNDSEKVYQKKSSY